MISLAEALARYPESLQALPAEPCRLDNALGRVLADDVHSPVSLPLFTQSAVDGYALRSVDTVSARDGEPVSLRLAGEIPAGGPVTQALTAGSAVRILTGGALPEGADAVARQEIVQRNGHAILLSRPVVAGADTRFIGEELRSGETLASAGQRLNAGRLAALAMAGVVEVPVRRRPRVVVLITGDEVAPSGTALAPGQVHDANGPLIRSWLVERGYPAPGLRYVADDPEAVEQALAEALEHADLVISSGGVSVGDRDFLPALAPKLGVRRVFWKVAQKPGKPLWFGVRDNTAFLGLPGNPGAVLIGLALHVARVLGVLEGAVELAPVWRTGVLDAPVDADRHRDRLVRVSLHHDGGGRARLGVLPRQGSHMLSNLARATALAWLPARTDPFEADEAVRWIPLAP